MPSLLPSETFFRVLRAAFVVGLIAMPCRLAWSLEDPPVDQKALFESLEKSLSQVRLTGHFTMDGKSMKDLNEEVYEIKSIKKLPEGKLWLITASIKYGKNDVTLPMPLTIEWANKTPVITLDKVTLPGLGTFSARVLFHDNKYAGTWTHDNVGGHMYGKIEKIASAEAPKGSEAPKNADKAK